MSQTALAPEMRMDDGRVVVWKDRYRGHANIDPNHLLAHPLNAHIHPEFQQKAMTGALGEMGWLDSIKVAVERASGPAEGFTVWLPDLNSQGLPQSDGDGAYWKIGAEFNGHMRTLLALRHNQAQVPVDFYELNDEEALYALLTFDSIGAQAYMDAQNMSSILDGVRTSNESVRQLMQRVGREAGLSVLPPHLAGTAPPVAGPTVQDVLAEMRAGADPQAAPVVPDAGAPQVARSIQDPDAPVDTEAPGARGKTPQESQMAYLTHTIKQVVLYFSSDEYTSVIQRLDRASTMLGLDNNTEIVLALLDHWEQTHAEDAEHGDDSGPAPGGMGEPGDAGGAGEPGGA